MVINDLLRKNIKGFKNYAVNNIDCKYKMDANETPFSLPEMTLDNLRDIVSQANVNRYPDPISKKLKERLAEYCNTIPSKLMVGNGSDELIHLLMCTFVDVGDYVLYPVPSFSMYKVYAQISGANCKEINLQADYSYNIDALIDYNLKYNPKLTFLCTPNNPTGTVISRDDIKKLLDKSNGLVVVDEAYYEFYGLTVVDLVREYNNLVVLRTLSKAYGLAGLRVGYFISNEDIVNCVSLVKPPYNVNSISQEIALSVINSNVLQNRVEYILNERRFLLEELSKIDKIKVFPSNANFILIRIDNANYVYKRLIEFGVLVRNFSNDPMLNNTLRITVGTRETNNYLIKCLKEITL